VTILFQKYWVIITTCTGLLVGTLRWAMKYPDNLPGFFKEVNTCHVDPLWAPHTVLLSAISIAGGANLGPEQALVNIKLISLVVSCVMLRLLQGNLGGGLATLINRRMEFENKDDQDLMILAGMSGAMGALFPTPVLAVLMIHELGKPPK
jgi:H+/Cl- antiporter ClcA